MADELDLTTKVISRPSNMTAPLSASTTPQIALRRVDLPAPLVPSRATISPWATSRSTSRKTDSGLASAIEGSPRVNVIYYGGADGPGPRFLSFKGSAHVDPSVNDTVYDALIEGERNADPQRKGVAVIVDVESVDGFGADGPFRMERTTG